MLLYRKNSSFESLTFRATPNDLIKRGLMKLILIELKTRILELEELNKNIDMIETTITNENKTTILITIQYAITQGDKKWKKQKNTF